MLSEEDTIHLRISQRAMATDFEIFLPRDAVGSDVDAAVTALDRLADIEQCLTIYDPTSELSRVNLQAADGPVKISGMLSRVLQRAAEAWRATAGAFDVTAGPFIEAWGFTTRSGKRPTEAELAVAQQRVGWQYVALDTEAHTLEFQRPGMTINLGAIGKGYALDLLAQDLQAAGVDNFLVHGGNSSLLASGDGWRVGLQHPTQSRRRIGGLTLNAAALATSGSGKQFFHYQGKRLGHVIDPRSGLPVDHMLSLSVVAAEATMADALATGLFVAGLDAVVAHAAQYPQIGLVAVLPSERAGEVQVRSWNIQLDDVTG